MDNSQYFPSQAVETLARWLNTLGSWDWPEDLPGKPEGYDEWPAVLMDFQKWGPNKHEYMRPYKKAIRLLLDGDKENLRWNHLYNLNRTNEQFEEWYADREKLLAIEETRIT